jgi:hypothetical protein
MRKKIGSKGPKKPRKVPRETQLKRLGKERLQYARRTATSLKKAKKYLGEASMHAKMAGASLMFYVLQDLACSIPTDINYYEDADSWVGDGTARECYTHKSEAVLRELYEEIQGRMSPRLTKILFGEDQV